MGGQATTSIPTSHVPSGIANVRKCGFLTITKEIPPTGSYSEIWERTVVFPRDHSFLWHSSVPRCNVAGCRLLRWYQVATSSFGVGGSIHPWSCDIAYFECL